jgi:hypothetical protein
LGLQTDFRFEVTLGTPTGLAVSYVKNLPDFGKIFSAFKFFRHRHRCYTAFAAAATAATAASAATIAKQHSIALPCFYVEHMSLLFFSVDFSSDAWRSLLDGSAKRQKRPRKTRVDFDRVDFARSQWQLMVTSGAYKIATTKAGRNFRRKCRSPPELFDFIVEPALHRKWFPVVNMGE